MTTEPEFYPMPSFPTLEVRNVAATAKWYADILGFQVVFSMPGPGGAPALVHLRWAKFADMLIRAEAAGIGGAKGVGITLSFAVTDGGLDALAERARAAGATILREPGDRPWNARDFTVADPDGFALTFTMGPLNKDLSFDAVTANARNAGKT